MFQDLFGARGYLNIKKKTSFTYKIQSVVHCRKFSMKQNVNVSSSELIWTYLHLVSIYIQWLLKQFSSSCSLLSSSWPLEKCTSFKSIFPGLSRSWNFQEKIQDFTENVRTLLKSVIAQCSALHQLMHIYIRNYLSSSAYLLFLQIHYHY